MVGSLVLKQYDLSSEIHVVVKGRFVSGCEMQPTLAGAKQTQRGGMTTLRGLRIFPDAVSLALLSSNLS
jgi:hypothetical protein